MKKQSHRQIEVSVHPYMLPFLETLLLPFKIGGAPEGGKYDAMFEQAAIVKEEVADVAQRLVGRDWRYCTTFKQLQVSEQETAIVVKIIKRGDELVPK